MSGADEADGTGDGSLATFDPPKPKWRLVLPPALRMAVTVLAAGAMASSCGAEEPAPVVAAKKFASAVQRGDVEAFLELVEAPVAERLSSAAERASDQVGGRRNVEAHEMMEIVDVDPRFQVAKAELVSGDLTQATVRLTGADDTTHDLGLVNEDGQWHVVVPLP